MSGTMARKIDGIPCLLLAERDTYFPTPTRDQRFQDRITGIVYRHDGTEWLTDITPSAPPAGDRTVTTVTEFLANNATFNVKDYGAVGDGASDDTTAIQAAIDAAKVDGGRVYFPPGQYRITSALDLTKSGSAATVAILIEGSGPRTTLISVVVAGAPGFDCTGRSFLTFRDFATSGNLVNMPTCAFLLARNNTHSTAGIHVFHNIQTLGYYSQAALYNYASEVVRHSSCHFTNSEPGAAVVQITKQNIAGLTSGYVTIGTGAISNTCFAFEGCDINNYGGSGGDCLYLEGVSQFSLTGASWVNLDGRSFVYIDASTSASSNIAIRDTMWDGGDTLYGLTVAGSGGEVTRIALENIYDVGVKAFASGGMTVYGQDNTNISGLRIRNLYTTDALYYRFYQLSNSHLTLWSADTLYLKYACTNNQIVCDATKLTIDRRDLALGNTIVALNSGLVLNPRTAPDLGDANVTLVTTDAPVQRWIGALSAARTVTLPSTGLYQGARFHIVRTATCTGAYNLTVQTSTPTTIKALTAASTWCTVEYNGTAWELIAAGSL